jgi:hypothetical protein
MAPMLKERQRDRGAAMVMAVTVAAVTFGLAAVMLSFANHQSTASNQDRLRQQAIDAASAGLVVADSLLTTAQPSIPTGWRTLPDGSQYSLRVEDTAGGNGFRRILTSTGRSPAGASEPYERRMEQVVELNPVTFTYGVFIEGGNFTGPTWDVTGDLYTNGSLQLDKNNTFTGNVFAQGDVDSQATVTGSISLNGNATIGGKTTTANVYAGGTISGCGAPRCKANLIPKPVPVQHLPAFPWPNASYPAGAYTSVTSAQFNSLSPTAGVFYVEGSLDVSKSLVLTGDLTLIASGNIALPGSVTKAAGVTSSTQLTAISTSPTGIVLVNNNVNFVVPVLVYSRGMFDGTKKNINSGAFEGALYVGSVDLHANLTFTYVPVKATGFDWTMANPQSFTIRHISTHESTGEATT